MTDLQAIPVPKNEKELTYYELNNKINIPVDGQIQLHYDKLATKAYFEQHINQKTLFAYSLEEKIDVLLKGNYIDKDMINKYEFKFIKKLFKFIYSKKFRFESFMGAYKFYRQYALKTDDGETYLERFEDRVAFNALYLADGDEELAMNIANEMINRRYQPATPTYLNAGKARAGAHVSCFLIGDLTDSMDSITRSWQSSAHLSKMGGGVGIDLSNIREEGAPIKGILNAASGVVPVMKIFEDIFSYANQLGQRQGAGAVYLNIFHMDVISFLATRKENADEKVRIKTLSLGLTIPDKFYELIKKDEWMYMFSPYDVERVYGKPFSFVDITAEYDNMVNNPEIRKSKVKARELETEISKLQQESGYPYILNIDTVNKSNNVHGKVVMSNLCTEILQVHLPSEINKDQTYKEVGFDVSCNLGSINIPNIMKTKDFALSTDTMVRALTTVVDKTNIEEVPTVKHANDVYHSIGLGAMGLATYFALNKMEYGSPESIEFTDVFFRLVNYYSLVSSNNIAKERKDTFYEFEKSKYYTGEYFDNYINEGDVVFEHPSVEKLFKGIHIPTVSDWKELKQKVHTHGLYHSYRMAVAPNGSISYVNETSASLHPIINLIEERQEKKIGKVYYPVPHLNNETIKYYTSAYDMDMRKVIDVYAAAQKHVDQGMSLTLFMRSDIPEGLYPWKEGRTTKMTTRDLNILRNYAWKKGIKSLYYVRTFTEDSEEIGASQCESCSI